VARTVQLKAIAVRWAGSLAGAMQRRQELEQGVADCSARALYASAKWAAAALCGLPEAVGPVGGSTVSAAATASDRPAYELARSLFDVKVTPILPRMQLASASKLPCHQRVLVTPQGG